MEERRLAVGEGYSLVDTHMALLRAFQAQRALLRPFGSRLGLAQGQPRIISYLAAHEHATQREMAEFFGMDPASVSRMLDALERGGYLESVPGRDRRYRSLALTEYGRETVRCWDIECHRVDEVMLKGFTPEERAQFDNLLDRARCNITRELGDAGDDVDALLADAVPPLPAIAPAKEVDTRA